MRGEHHIGHATPSIRGVAGEVFRLRPGSRAGSLVFVAVIPFVAAIGIIAALEGQLEAAFLAAIWVIVFTSLIGHELLFMPFEVTLDETCVRFRATVRQVSIPWTELETVQWTGWSGRLKWWRTDGRSVTTSHAFDDRYRMLKEVELRAPHIQVLS
jgi:hypothetical protein